MAHDLKKMHLAFVGCGVMGESMVAGLLRKELVDAANITASHPRENRRTSSSARFVVRQQELALKFLAWLEPLQPSPVQVVCRSVDAVRQTGTQAIPCLVQQARGDQQCSIVRRGDRLWGRGALKRQRTSLPAIARARGVAFTDGTAAEGNGSVEVLPTE